MFYFRKKTPMKKFIKLLFLLCVALHGSSQGLNAELGFNDEYFQFAQGVACDGAYTYLVIHEGETGTIDFAGIGATSKLLKIDTLGNIIWNVVLAPKSAQCVHLQQIIVSSDGSVYLFGYAEMLCAHPGNGNICFIQKQDPSGNVLWIIDWAVNDLTSMPYTGFTLNATGEMLLNHTSSNGSWMYTISPSGLITDSVEITEPEIAGFSELSGFSVTGFRDESLMGFNSAGILLQTITFSTPVKGIHSRNDTLYVLTQDSIFSFSGNLQPILASAAPAYSSYGSLKVDMHSISFLSYGSGSLTVITLNRQLQVTKTLTIPEPINQDAIIDFNNMQLSAGITFNLAEFSAVRFLNYSLISTVDAILNRTDVGVVDLLPTQVTTSLYSQVPPAYSTRLEADILIKNYGPDTLYSCRITRFNGLSVMVNPTVYAQVFHNLGLAPGDSMWLSLGAIYQGTAFPPGNEIKRNICIHTNNPNGLVDLNVSNDEFCKEIVFGYVGIEKSESKEIFTLFPNPTTGLIHFDLPPGAVEFLVVNMHGKVVQGGQTLQRHIDLSLLSAGVYAVRILSLQYGNEIAGKVLVIPR
jgi:hypothetical protein